jgi:hypothetical protein
MATLGIWTDLWNEYPDYISFPDSSEEKSDEGQVKSRRFAEARAAFAVRVQGTASCNWSVRARLRGAPTDQLPIGDILVVEHDVSPFYGADMFQQRDIDSIGEERKGGTGQIRDFRQSSSRKPIFCELAGRFPRG